MLLHSQGTSICPCVLGSCWGEAVEEQTVLFPGAEKLLCVALGEDVKLNFLTV